VPAVQGVLKPGLCSAGGFLSRTVVLVVEEKVGDERPAGGSKARKGRVRVELLLEGGLEAAGVFVAELVLIVRAALAGLACKGLLIGCIGCIETCDDL
jgi:hypothetical protein